MDDCIFPSKKHPSLMLPKFDNPPLFNLQPAENPAAQVFIPGNGFDDYIACPEIIYDFDASDDFGNSFSGAIDINQDQGIIIQDQNINQTQDVIYQCEFCDKQSPSLLDIQLHIQEVHTTNTTVEMPATSTANTVITSGTSQLPKPKSKRSLKVKSKKQLKELLTRLRNFDWCTCTICIKLCRIFFEHVITDHEVPSPAEPQPSEVEDYFQKNYEINLPPPAATITEDIDMSESVAAALPENSVLMQPLPEPLFAPPPLLPPKAPTTIVTPTPASNFFNNSSKKVFFKIKKYGDLTTYICTVCKLMITDYGEIQEHFKVHAVGEEAVPKIQIKSTIVTQQGKTADEITEYQCGLCGNISTTRAVALKCLKIHKENGWTDSDSIVNDNESYKSLADADLVALTPLMDDTLGPTYGDFADSFIHSMDVAGEMTVDDDLNCSNFQESEKITYALDTPLNASDSIFKCDPCDQYFESRDEIEAHIKIIHGENCSILKADEAQIRHIIKCSICKDAKDEPVLFKSIQESLQHRREKHYYSISYASTKPLTRFLVKMDGTECAVTENLRYYKRNTNVEEFQCVCKMIYAYKSLAEKCLAKHIGIKRFVCKKPHKVNNGFCGLQFYTAQDLQHHDERIHQGTNPFIKIICEQCGQTVIKSHLNAHIKQKHTPQEKKVCPDCGKLLTSEKRLKIHIRSVHKQEKRHRCQVCMTPFVWKSGADLCYAMHSGKKSVQCELCDKTFYTVQQKITHRVTAHPKVPRNYLCDQCDFVGASLTLLKVHLSELHS